MKVIPSSARRCAKVAFSERKPYPGCTASAPTSLAAEIIASMSSYDASGSSRGIKKPSSASLTGRDILSSRPWMTTESIPFSLNDLTIRRAISPRLATRTRRNTILWQMHRRLSESAYQYTSRKYLFSDFIRPFSTKSLESSRDMPP